MRLFLDILIVLALFIAPFFVICILAFIGLIFFSHYVEFIVFALFAELIYRGGDVHILGMLLPFTIIALFWFLIAEFLKVFIRTRMI